MLAKVVSGKGVAQRFLALPPYQLFFSEHLRSRPFPGTLNLECNLEQAQAFVETLGTPFRLEEFAFGGTRFGGVSAWSVRVSAKGKDVPALLVKPDKTTHAVNTLELVAVHSLRKQLSLEDGEELEIEKE